MYPIYKGQEVVIAGNAIIEVASRKVVARATIWKDGSIVASDAEAGEFIAEHTGGEWDGREVHPSGCTCEFCRG